MSTTITNNAADLSNDLLSMLSDLGMPTDDTPENTTAAVTDIIDAPTDDLFAALRDIEIDVLPREQAIAPLGDDGIAVVEHIVTDEGVPATLVKPITEPGKSLDEIAAALNAATEVKTAKPKRERKKKEPAADAAPKTPKVYWGKNKLGRLEAGLGDKLKDYLLLTVSEAALEGEELTARVAENTAMFKGLGVKVQNRATNLIEFAAGKRNGLNGVIETTIRLLAADGQLTTGDKGNVISALVAHPYSIGAARAMGNNTINMLRNLQMVDLGAKGVLVPNPDSLLLQVVAGKLQLDFGTDPIGDEDDHEGSTTDVAAIEPEPELVMASDGTVSVIEPESPMPVDAVVSGALDDLIEAQINKMSMNELLAEEAPF